MNIDFDSIIRNFEAKANSIYNDNEKISELIDKVRYKIENNETFQDIKDDILTTIDMVIDWKNGDYQEISQKSITLIIIGFLYLLNPLNILPKFLKKSFIDDLIVIVYLLKILKEEIEKYREWKTIDRDFIEITLVQETYSKTFED